MHSTIWLVHSDHWRSSHQYHVNFHWQPYKDTRRLYYLITFSPCCRYVLIVLYDKSQIFPKYQILGGHWAHALEFAYIYSRYIYFILVSLTRTPLWRFCAKNAAFGGKGKPIETRANVSCACDWDKSGHVFLYVAFFSDLYTYIVTRYFFLTYICTYVYCYVVFFVIVFYHFLLFLLQQIQILIHQNVQPNDAAARNATRTWVTVLVLFYQVSFFQ